LEEPAADDSIGPAHASLYFSVKTVKYVLLLTRQYAGVTNPLSNVSKSTMVVYFLNKEF